MIHSLEYSSMDDTIIFWVTVIGFIAVLLGGAVSFLDLKDRLWRRSENKLKTDVGSKSQNEKRNEYSSSNEKHVPEDELQDVDSTYKSTSEQIKPSGSQELELDLVEKQVGILSSNIANYPVRYETFRFRGSLLGEVFIAYNNGYEKQELYVKPDGRYLVYVEEDRNHDYWISHLAGAMAHGERESSLSLNEVQEEYPELATEAGTQRVTDV